MEEDLIVKMRDFVGVMRGRDLKFSADKTKMKVLGEEEGLVCEIVVDGTRLEHVSEFKYLGDVLAESNIDGVKCRRRVESGMKVAGAIIYLVNDESLQFDCAKILHKTLVVPVLLCGSEAMACRKKERSRIRGVRMDNLKGFYELREQSAKFGVMRVVWSDEEVDERIDESVLR